jgi:hypothetical protein
MIGPPSLYQGTRSSRQRGRTTNWEWLPLFGRTFKVEASWVATPNLLTFQLVMGYKQFYEMGMYIPPNDTAGVDVLWAAWHACPDGCILIVMGDLNINFEHTRDEREEVIANLLDKINLIDSTCKFCLRQCWFQSARRKWSWQQKWMGR